MTDSLTSESRRSILRVDGARKSFHGVPALVDVNLSVAHGTIHALAGGNGSGKSTLIKMLAGVYHGDAGTIAVGDNSHGLNDMTPAMARRLGLRFVHQDPAIIDGLTVAENVGLAVGFPRGRMGGVAWHELRRRTQELLDRFDVHARPDQPAESLRPATRTMLAIARALGDDAEGDRILVLDEPTASLPAHEVDVLIEALQRRARAGQTILYVSHRLAEVRAMADQITVLRDGRVVADQSARELSAHDIVELMSGEPLDDFYPPAPDSRAETSTILEVRGVTAGPLRDVSVAARGGEILGIAGLLGSGRSTMLRVMFGDMGSDAEVLIDGQHVPAWSLHEAMRHGVVYVPENRQADALLGDLTVRENFTIASLSRVTRGLRISRRRERSGYGAMARMLSIKAASSELPITGLSGGNAQKVVLGRWLEREPRVILLDEPTQGVDAMARSDIYHTLRQVSAGGASIIIASSDVEELAHLCDRVIVLRRGEIVSELTRPELSIGSIIQQSSADEERGQRHVA